MPSIEPHKKWLVHGLNIAALSVVAFTLSACPPSGAIGPGNSDRAYQELMLPREASAGEVTENARKCEAIGGAWRQDGMLSSYHCFEVYSDGRKSCTDTMQCEGECRAYSIEAKSGTCQIDSGPFGCHGQMIEGAATNFICVD